MRSRDLENVHSTCLILYRLVKHLFDEVLSGPTPLDWISEFPALPILVGQWDERKIIWWQPGLRPTLPVYKANVNGMLYVHKLVKHLYDEVLSGPTPLDSFPNYLRSQSWLVNETREKEFDDNRAWDRPCQFIKQILMACFMSTGNPWTSPTTVKAEYAASRHITLWFIDFLINHLL